MRKILKKSVKVLKVSLIAFVILLAAIIVLPFVFKGRIMETAKQEINKNIEARVDFSDFGLNLISAFPNFSFHLDELSVTGINDFEGDTLAAISSVTAVIDVMSVIRGEVYQVRKVLLDKPFLRLKVLKNGMANWDIVPAAEESPAGQEGDAGSEGFNISLRKFEIRQAMISYEDLQGNLSFMIHDLDHTLSGDLSLDKTYLDTRTEMASLTFKQDGISYLKNTAVGFDATIEADLKNEMYTFKRNELRINELILQFDGSVAMIGEDTDILLTFNAPHNTFRNFLSLVPSMYTDDFRDIETTGTLAFNGYVKGIYAKNSLPSFNLDVLAENASFRYPGLPSSVNDISIDMNINSPGGDEDNTVIDVRQFRFTMIDNPFDFRVLIRNPISDPFVDGSLKARFDLFDVGSVFPLGENESLSGILDVNVTIKGRQSAIENQEFDKFEVFGSLLLKDMAYSAEGFVEEFLINNAQMNFTPAYIDLVNLDFKYAESDMTMQGKFENYIPYALNDGNLKGRFTVDAGFFNVDQFIGEEDAGTSEGNTQDTLALTAFKVPSDIDFEMDARIKKLLYDGIEMDNITGMVIVRDEKVILNNLRGDIFNGSLEIDGSYSTKDTEKPKVELAMEIDRISFQDAFKTFGILDKYAPIFSHALGDFSTQVDFSTLLNEDMNPDWMSFLGKGLLNASAVKLENVNTLNKLSDVMKTDFFTTLNLDPVKMAFDIEDGKLMVKPFDLDLNGMKANLSGWTALDQTIGYELKMEVPSRLLGSEANNVINGLISQANTAGANFSAGETIPLNVLIGGSLTDPTVKPLIGKSAENIVKGIKEDIKEEIIKQKEELEQQVREEARKILDEADMQAKKVMMEAEKQAAGIRKIAGEAAQKIRNEADAHAEKLIAEGKRNGVLAEVAAKKTAEEYKKNAYKEADNVVAEADKKAGILINTARQQAGKIRADAQKRIDNL